MTRVALTREKAQQRRIDAAPGGCAKSSELQSLLAPAESWTGAGDVATRRARRFGFGGASRPTPRGAGAARLRAFSQVIM
jgi:hypothetical protein